MAILSRYQPTGLSSPTSWWRPMATMRPPGHPRRPMVALCPPGHPGADNATCNTGDSAEPTSHADHPFRAPRLLPDEVRRLISLLRGGMWEIPTSLLAAPSRAPAQQPHQPNYGSFRDPNQGDQLSKPSLPNLPANQWQSRLAAEIRIKEGTPGWVEL
jgi:hypothetical protein